jgi:hypothetical protein
MLRKNWIHVGILTDRCGMRPESLLCTAYDRLANQDESCGIIPVSGEPMKNT